MKKKLVIKILYTLLAILQTAIIVGVFILQYLTNKKAGVLRHVYYRKYQFENSIFSPQNISTQRMLVLLILLLLIGLLIYVMKKNKGNFYKIQIIIGLVLSVLLVSVMTSGYFISMVAYHYFVMAFTLTLLIQLIIILCSSLYNINK